MRKSEMTNKQLLEKYTNSCFRITNYPYNKKENLEYERLLKELGKRLDLDNTDIEEIMKSL